MNLALIQRAAAGILLFSAAIGAYGQDLIARQAPIDRKLKAVDSVALQRYLDLEAGDNADGLYSTWNTSYAHCYAREAVPDSFKIDLRGFCMPTPSRNVTSRFGYRAAFRRQHKGLDIKVYTGDTIRAAFDGKIRVVRYEGGGYGNFVVIRHNNGLETIYGHLSKHLVTTDQDVKAGEPIGLGGNTGRSFGSHLHFETRLLGEAIDPELLFDFPNQDVTGDFYTFHKPSDARNHTASRIDTDTPSDTEKQAPRAAATARDVHYHKVKRGESLYAIANKVGRTVDQLCKMNRLTKKSKLRPGQILRY